MVSLPKLRNLDSVKKEIIVISVESRYKIIKLQRRKFEPFARIIDDDINTIYHIQLTGIVSYLTEKCMHPIFN